MRRFFSNESVHRPSKKVRSQGQQEKSILRAMFYFEMVSASRRSDLVG